MDLWIRSQYKEMLFKVNNSLIIRHNDTTNGMYFIECDKQKIAMYKTRERALEVLNEIQNALLDEWANNVEYEDCYDNERPRSLVYQMPEE